MSKKFQKQYIEERLHATEENSIVLVNQGKRHYFPYVFARVENNVCMKEVNSSLISFMLQLNSGNGTDVDIDIRYTVSENCRFRVYYMDIPEHISLYVENWNNKEIHIDMGKNTVDIAGGEKKQISKEDYQPDYQKFIDYSFSLPKNLGRFTKEAISQEINLQDAFNPGRNYMTINNFVKESETRVKDERIMQIVSGAVGMSLLMNPDRTMQLVEGGGLVDVGDFIKWSEYNIRGQHMYSASCTLMEWMAFGVMLQHDIFTVLWTKAKEHSQLHLQGQIKLKLHYDEKCYSELVNKLCKLSKIWKEAAEELLLALTDFFLERKISPEDCVWHTIFREFPNMRRKLIMKIFSFFTAQYIFEEQKISAYWELYWQYEEPEEAKRTQIYLLRDHSKIVDDSDEIRRCFLPMFLKKGNIFGNMEPGVRDMCVRRFIKEKNLSKYVWDCLLATDFIPIEYVDEYIVSVKDTVKCYLVPLLIAAKFTGTKDSLPQDALED